MKALDSILSNLRDWLILKLAGDSTVVINAKFSPEDGLSIRAGKMGALIENTAVDITEMPPLRATMFVSREL